MAGYLRRYVGIYRVKADYDAQTMDFPRLENGTLDPSFDDFYIVCKNNIKIRHGYGNVLSCYIPSYSRGLNVLRKIFNDKIIAYDKSIHTNEIVIKKLLESKFLLSIEVLSEEIYFTFKADNIEYITGIVGVLTNGKNINPLSSKNLPKIKYVIPECNLNQYKELIDKLPKVKRTLQGVETIMVDGLIVNKTVSDFDEIIQQIKGKDFDIKTDRKKRCLKGINYIHSLGLWDEFIKYLEINTHNE